MAKSKKKIVRKDGVEQTYNVGSDGDSDAAAKKAGTARDAAGMASTPSMPTPILSKEEVRDLSTASLVNAVSQNAVHADVPVAAVAGRVNDSDVASVKSATDAYFNAQPLTEQEASAAGALIEATGKPNDGDHAFEMKQQLAVASRGSWMKTIADDGSDRNVMIVNEDTVHDHPHVAPVPLEEIGRFADYSLNFYGEHSEDSKTLGYFADNPEVEGGPMTRAEALAGAALIASGPNWGGGDSFDRERMRDAVLIARGQEPWGIFL